MPAFIANVIIIALAIAAWALFTDALLWFTS
jgi:hypothetical protein